MRFVLLLPPLLRLGVLFEWQNDRRQSCKNNMQIYLWWWNEDHWILYNSVSSRLLHKLHIRQIWPFHVSFWQLKMICFGLLWKVFDNIKFLLNFKNTSWTQMPNERQPTRTNAWIVHEISYKRQENVITESLSKMALEKMKYLAMW